MSTHETAVTVYRGNIIENTHIAHIAVVDAEGKLLCGFGDSTRMTLARSAAKPAQALAILETGAVDQFDFDDADLALVCASHNSEDRHIERTRSMLAKVHAGEADLQCGGLDSISSAVNRAWIKRGYTPTAICSDCSGKHVGMLGGARALGASIENYHLPDHPMQKHVKRVIAQLCNLSDDAVGWAVDGCNLPTPAFPLDRLAYIYARLACSADIVDPNESAARTVALARIFHAMTTHPEMVAGEGRYCTALMRAFEGRVVGKLGADACYGIGVRASDDTKRLGVDGAIGIAVKVEDGDTDILYMIVSEVLARLEIGTAGQRKQLSSFHRPKMLNTRGVEIGHATFPFELRRY
jgi:L-asparaginase II